MRYSLAKISDELGVSKASISLVLNGKADQHGISKGLKNRILKFCEDKNYSINIHAKRMNQKLSCNIGILLAPTDVLRIDSPLSEYNTAEILGGIALAASKRQFRFTVEIADHEMPQENISQWFRSKEIDGLIFFGFNLPGSWKELLLQENRAVVGIGIDPADSFPSVNVNNYSGSYQITEYLLKKGHTDFLFLGGIKIAYTTRERLKGFADALKSYGIPFNEKHSVYYADFQEKLAYEWIKERMNQEKVKETAIVCANDDMAIGVIRGLKESGLNIPDDIAVTGGDNINLSRYITPALTTYCNRPLDQGESAFNLLYGLINRENILNPHISLDTTIVVREST